MRLILVLREILLATDRTTYTILVIMTACFLVLYLRANWRRRAVSLTPTGKAGLVKMRVSRPGVSYMVIWVSLFVILMGTSVALDADWVHHLVMLVTFLAGGVGLLCGEYAQIRVIRRLGTQFGPLVPVPGDERARRLARASPPAIPFARIREMGARFP
jgi:hypothetical protein